MSAWIEIRTQQKLRNRREIALLVSAWIEIRHSVDIASYNLIALLVSAWIEIAPLLLSYNPLSYRTPCECVD